MYHVICYVTKFILHWDTTHTIYYRGHWLRVPQFSPYIDFSGRIHRSPEPSVISTMAMDAC